MRVDALRVVHPIAALCVALKGGVLYLIARRVIEGPRGTVQALAAPLLALVPAVYFLGSFFQFFFFAQVVSETFAIAMLLAVVGMGARRGSGAICGCSASWALACSWRGLSGSDHLS